MYFLCCAKTPPLSDSTLHVRVKAQSCQGWLNEIAHKHARKFSRVFSRVEYPREVFLPGVGGGGTPIYLKHRETAQGCLL